jgi:hypothetical protein
MRASLFIVSTSFASVVVAAGVARADDKQACNDAYRQAQVLRNDHKLVEAREQLRICAGGACPGFIAKDCSDWLKADESRTPSVVLAAKNAGGADVTDAKVTMDGAVLATKLDGLAIDVDPGAHTFVFESPEGRAEQKVVVTEGGKAQRIAVSLGNAGGAPAGVATSAVALVSPAPAGSAPPAAPAAPAKSSWLSEPAQNGLSFGFRTGYALPAGSVDSVGGTNESLSTFVSGEVPLWFDAGYLLNPYFYVGAYFSYGIAQVPASAITTDGVQICGLSTVSCTGSNLRVGVDVQFRVLGTSKLQPWVGLGFLGYESATFGASNNNSGVSASETLSGIEWVNPQLGFDYKFLPFLSAGLFAGISLSEYLGLSTNPSSATATLGDKALHEWIYMGARTSFDLHI